MLETPTVVNMADIYGEDYNVMVDLRPVRCKVILDSVSSEGIRLVTMHMRYPRFIHPELITHRAFSRNARSSRAVPTNRLLEEPIFLPSFMQNQSGMQSYKELPIEEAIAAEKEWLALAIETRKTASKLHSLRVHKQWANRPLEWFGFIDVLVSATSWANFITLRDHPAAAPEIQTLGKLVRSSINQSKPTMLQPGQWHLPYITAEEHAKHPIDMLCMVSVARCARISYKPFDGSALDIASDLELTRKLIGSEPLHASPAEHQATPDEKFSQIMWKNPRMHGNFTGWVQYRKTLPNEYIADKEYFHA